MWWEILLVKQTGEIIDLKQKITEISSTNETILIQEIETLHQKKKMKVIMIAGEGTVFLLLLIFGIYKIRQAHNKEQELNNQQKNFFLSITHELKTPIAATKLQIQTLLKHKLEPDKQNELLTNALNETERLNALIDNVLLASRFDSGEFVFKKEKEDISELTVNIINRYYKNELAKNEISLQIDKNLFIELDKTTFPSILTNLIDNALKYSFEQKNIFVLLKKTDQRITLAVKDLGCGISENDKKKIFTKFYRAGNEETRTAKGTGLGLYIVNYLAKKHDAKLLVKNNTPKGSVFEIEFNAI